MTNRKRTTLCIAGAVLLAIIVLIIPALLFGAKALKSRIEATASRTLGMDVRVKGGASVSVLPVFSASLADITVKSGGAVAEVSLLTSTRLMILLNRANSYEFVS